VQFKVTHTKITQLIVELRSWEDETPLQDRPSMNVLAERYQLPVSAVRKIAESEGVDVRWVDPNASTLDLDPRILDRAMAVPESNPNYADADTGVWQKKPTGEWQRVPPGHTFDDDED
jgi:hypothetical protein